MRRRHLVLALAVATAVAALVAACESTTPIPGGAQQVRVTLGDSVVVLKPATVHPGDVYLVLDAPDQTAVYFVARTEGAGAAAEPLTDAELARIASGNVEGTSTSGLDTGHCSPEQNAAAQGRLGPCSNVMKLTVAAGKYAILDGPPELAVDGGPRPNLAVLTVVP